MLRKNAAIRVIFNDAHANLPSNSYIPQGGVASFARKLCNYFDETFPEIELVSLLFSHNANSKDIYIKETIGNHKYYELFYPREKLIKSYKKEYTKKEYTKFLEPWLKQVDSVFEKIQPNIVFLNGFSLSNWLILETAHRRKVPVCIQHAGIWKKEISTSVGAFSSSIKKIFNSYEKDAFRNASHQIFLNEFSRDVFFSLHNIPKNNKTFSKTSVIPLPIEIKKYSKIIIPNKKHYNIGSVARWDRIKNHDAILRLAKYLKENSLPMSIKVVTNWNNLTMTDYKKEYCKFIEIIKPMSPEKLKDFYSTQDIIIIPSRFDVSPTVLMEAILSGKPVIISNNVGWISDYNKFNLNKLIINSNSSGKVIYNTINELISNKDKYIKLFTKMQQKIIIKHDTEVVFKQYYNIFKKIS